MNAGNDTVSVFLSVIVTGIVSYLKMAEAP